MLDRWVVLADKAKAVDEKVNKLPSSVLNNLLVPYYLANPKSPLFKSTGQ
jgi:hypothetical protein